jgi:polysaccharide pyruvyl transferase WcaK-like protein
MIIQIDGTNTLNKGAELMLVAIIEQIEKKYPDANVIYNSNEKPINLTTNVKIKKRIWQKNSKYIISLFSKLNIPYTIFTSKYPHKNIDIVLDASGFQFSDQWNYTDERLDTLEQYLRTLNKQGTKIILLPQAMGPFETKNGKRAVDIINNFTDIIIAREQISYDYVIEAGANKRKVWKYPDFTGLVKGILPEKYNHLKGKVCIIPNKKMVTQTSAGSGEYLEFLKNVILEFNDLGKEVFLLNHEGLGDLKICNEINTLFNETLEVVTDLNAKEVKGLIGVSYITVSSRFHGVASALSQGVPCLATSWNHKYKMMFQDYELQDQIINVNDVWETTKTKIHETFNNHDRINRQLLSKKVNLTIEIESMWDKVWSTIN